MKKTLLALTIASTLTPAITLANQVENSAKNQVNETETIVVTSNPYKQSTDEIMSTVSIINRIDIDRIQPKSVAELLQATAGIDIASNGGPAQVSSVFVRGTNSTHTLFLVDGVRIERNQFRQLLKGWADSGHVSSTKEGARTRWALLL